MATDGSGCDHRRSSLLGVDSTAYFYRCDNCGTVLVVQGGHVWRISPKALPH